MDLKMIFFAILAAYLLVRLWGVLGKTTPEDDERREAKRKAAQERLDASEDNVVPMHVRKEHAAAEDVVDQSDHLPMGVRDGLRLLSLQDPDFDLDLFLENAEQAYRMIYDLFTKGNFEKMKPFMTADILKRWQSIFDEEKAQDRKIDVKIEDIRRIDVDSVRIIDDQAEIRLRIRADQIIIQRDAEGTIVDNPAEISTAITDIWTFTRPISSDSPVWHLSAIQE